MLRWWGQLYRGQDIGGKASGWVPAKGIDYDDLATILKASGKQNRWANGGPVLKKLSRIIGHHLGLPRDWVVIPTSSGTAALQALVWAWSQEVKTWVVPAYSWPGLDTAFRGIEGVRVVDVNPKTGSLPYGASGASGTVLTTLAGHLTVQAELFDPKMRIIWDNCGSADLVYDELVRADGIALSFHHTKPWGFGEGGAAAVPIRLADRVMQAVGYYYSGPTVLNGKMTEVQAALILQRYRVYDQVKEHCNALRNALLGALLGRVPYSLMPHMGSGAPFSGWVPIRLKSEIKGVEIAGKEVGGVRVRQLYRPRGLYPEAQDWYNKTLAIPVHEGLGESDMARVARELESVF